MTSQNTNPQSNATSTNHADSLAATDTVAANDKSITEALDSGLDSDNGIDLAAVFEPYFRPDDKTIVCGALDDEKITALAKSGVELVINLQPDDELTFDEAVAVEQAGMSYEHLPINGATELKQLKILAFDNILRQHHGKKIAMHCGSGNRVGAAIALRAGWLRGRKMDTAMERGRSHGLTKLEQEVHNRLLVPR
ncbi:beta-lactamase hydrolase domain-containing protein [Psychrobacter sp. T6-6]|uniref:beta-lactamase hydrolase domain-containing protein n=1 Tax=Psychrobacter sp. T6-6 TaxID=3457452 RepID=UPI003FD537FA